MLTICHTRDRSVHPTAKTAETYFVKILRCVFRERGGSEVERRTPEREVGGFEAYLRRCVLEQDTLFPESTGNTQEAVTPS